jgi:hypothetical protein
MPKEQVLASLRGVEIARQGAWQLASGKLTVTEKMLEDAARYAQSKGDGYHAPIKLGHHDDRFDGEPALGWLQNLRVEADAATAEPVLVGDIVDMPAWLEEAAPKHWPKRSMEGWTGYVGEDGEKYDLVVDGLALLGVTPPGIESLKSLKDLPQLLGVAASARISASAPVHAKGPGGNNNPKGKNQYSTGGGGDGTEGEGRPGEQSENSVNEAVDKLVDSLSEDDQFGVENITGPMRYGDWEGAEEGFAADAGELSPEGRRKVRELLDKAKAGKITAAVDLGGGLNNPGGSNQFSSGKGSAKEKLKVKPNSRKVAKELVQKLRDARMAADQRQKEADRAQTPETVKSAVAELEQELGDNPRAKALLSELKSGNEGGAQSVLNKLAGGTDTDASELSDSVKAKLKKLASAIAGGRVNKSYSKSVFASGKENEKGAGMDPVKLREAFGLAPDASDEDLASAMSSDGLVLASQADRTPRRYGAVPEGAVFVDEGVLAGLQKAASEGKEAAAWVKQQRKDEILDGAIQAGKFPPARRDHWEKLYDADPDGTREHIESMAPGLLPVVASGYAGSVEEHNANTLFDQMYPKGGN